jgi:class 3 adenylate cyclase
MTRRSTPTRGFLFADLRGYTAYAETHGDDAAAALLRSYRALVRRVISHFDGAEIRTEGDSFYVVFPSASDAVLAGLAILDDAAGVTEGAPMRIGVGVHAGEATETDEGFVGGAVNLAARVCAAAGPGQLFVTDTVRGITRGQLPARFIPRGTRRLKGIAEAVPVFSVVSGVAPPVKRWSRSGLSSMLRRRLNRLALPLALAVGVLVLTAGAIALIGPDLGGRAQEGPTPTAAVAVTSASASASPPPAEPDPAATREAANDRLRARIDPEVARLCTDADPEDAPLYDLFFIDAREPIPTLAGLRCELGGRTGPDVVEYWLALRETEPSTSPGRSSQGAFFYLVGQRNLPPGDCSTETRAWGPWEFGASSGNLLCSRFGGEALLMWTYQGTTVIARAERADGDSELLYRWWEDHARLLAPEPSG